MNTTPESLDLYRIFHELEQAGGTHVTMEVSSHALALGESTELRFTPRYSPISPGTTWISTRRWRSISPPSGLLFAPEGAPPPRWAVLNHDDAWGRQIAARQPQVLRYGFEAGADLRAATWR